MSNKKRILGILTAVMMLFTMTGTGVFAKSTAGSGPAVSAQLKSDATLKAASTSTTLPRLTKVTPVAGYHSIMIRWAGVKGADAYKVERLVDGQWKHMKFIKGGVFEMTNAVPCVSYDFRIIAVKLKDKNGALSEANIDGQKVNGNWVGNVSPAYKVKKGCVRPMIITVKVKSGRSFGGVYYKKGTRIRTDGFSGGKYYFTNSKGVRCSCGRITTGSPRAEYLGRGKYNYTLYEANYFMDRYMKERGLGSKTYAIWVSSFTQHLYVFKKVNGKWTNVGGKNWEICMGKADSPSPTGAKKIHKKIGSRHGIGYWSCYSSMNALHGKSSDLRGEFGNLASGGCIRNPNKNAKWIYKNCSIGTRVVVY